MRLVPEGTLVSRSRLREYFSISAIDNLVKSQQLETVIGGVYKREGTEIHWPAVVFFLQDQKASDWTVGGLTAMELQKLGHYIPLNDQLTIHLYGSENLPKWACSLVPNVTFQKHSIAILLGYQPDDSARKHLAEFTKVVNLIVHLLKQANHPSHSFYDCNILNCNCKRVSKVPIMYVLKLPRPSVSYWSKPNIGV